MKHYLLLVVSASAGRIGLSGRLFIAPEPEAKEVSAGNLLASLKSFQATGSPAAASAAAPPEASTLVPHGSGAETKSNDVRRKRKLEHHSSRAPAKSGEPEKVPNQDRKQEPKKPRSRSRGSRGKRNSRSSRAAMVRASRSDAESRASSRAGSNTRNGSSAPDWSIGSFSIGDPADKIPVAADPETQAGKKRRGSRGSHGVRKSRGDRGKKNSTKSFESRRAPISKKKECEFGCDP